MSVSPCVLKGSPERSISELCMNLESQFINVQELSKSEGMRVYARIRPMLDSEIEAGYKECIRIIDDQTVRAVVPSSSAKYKSSSHFTHDTVEDFTFTAAYGPGTGQFVFFEECMMHTMQNFIEGQNNLVFSYGTTGSGKTFTLQGNVDNPGIIPLSLHLFFAAIEGQLLDKIIVKPDKFADVIILNDDEMKRELAIKEQLLASCEGEERNYKNTSSKKSLAMMLCDAFSENFETECRETTLSPEEMAQAQAAALMKELSKKSADQQTGYCNVWISFVEIYNENIYDLLQPNLNQRIKLTLGEDKNGDVYVKGAREICVSNSYEALKLLSFGQRNLNIASTKLNYKSSRSHCIFTVRVVRLPDPENMSCAKINRLSFCDLAGSERAAKSQTTGMRLKEAGCINTSLLVLGRCLEQLRLKPSLRDKKLIPFRESKLTRLFSGFFTGRGKAVMVTNASPSELTFDETLHVLRFSALAKELIMNDSYIATASNTLQSITNMWANTRTNTSNSSDRSISFDDSMDDALQEKDQLIEKLLDLAESLKNNLEKERKEKAELEIKIREKVCEEYSQFSDELLENQRQNYAQEREAIKEIYQKRISNLEKMYENIINDYKLQLEESDSSEDEAFEIVQAKGEDEAFEIVQAKGEKSTKITEQKITSEFAKDTDFTSDFFDVSAVAEESKRTKEELHKTVDYSLSLEMELETLRKEMESIKLQLQATLKDNEEMKKELDSCKIDCYAFRTDNENLLAEKSALEQDIISLSKDLQSKDELIGVNEELTAEKDKELEVIKTEYKSLQKEMSDMQVEMEDLVQKLKSASKELELKDLAHKEELNIVNEKLEAAHILINDQKIEINNLLEDKNSNEIELENLKNLKNELEEKVSENETENLSCSQELDITMKKLIEAESTINEHKIHIDNLLNDIKNKNSEIEELTKLISENESLKKLNNELEEKNTKIETENVSYYQELDVTRKRLIEAESTINEQKIHVDDLLNDIKNKNNEIEKLTKLIHENESLKKLINELEEKNSKIETEKLSSKQELELLNKKLDEAHTTISNQKSEIGILLTDSDAHKREIEKLTNLNKELTKKINVHFSQSGLVSELVHVLENCEFHGTNKIKMMNSNSLELNNKLEKLVSQAKAENEDHKRVVDTLYKLIEILQKCEVAASTKVRRMHTSSFKHLELIQNLGKRIKDKENEIEVLKNDYVSLQKHLKDSGSNSKKQEENEKKPKVTKKCQREKRNTSVEKVVEDKSKIKVYEDKNENKNIENISQAMRVNRKKLGSVENIGSDVGVVQNKDLSSTKASKRKGCSERNKNSLDQRNMKKKKLHGNENLPEPENNTVKLLKEIKNNNAVFSPRVTRGLRKRLVSLQPHIQQSSASPQTLRSWKIH